MRALLCSLLLLLAGCDAGRAPVPSAASTEPFEVHFQSDFEDDFVEVFVDGVRVYAARVTTRDVLSLAAEVPLAAAPGRRTVRVRVEGQATALPIDPAEVAVVAVTYDRRQWQIELTPLAERPLYD